MTIEKSSDIINGQDISRTVIQQGEVQNVYNNGSATSTTVNNNGAQNVYNNGSTTSTTVNNNGAQNVYNNASAYVTTVNNEGVQNIHDGGYGFYTTVNQGGYITTTNNGISFQPYIQSNGYEDVGFNKFTQSSSVGSSVSAQLYGGSQYVYSGSIASNTTVFNGGASIILGYGSAISTNVNSGGRQEVYGNASHTVLDDTAVLNVTQGGRTFDTIVQKKSAENVFKNGSATRTVVENNGAQNVYNNGSTTSTIVNNNGAQNVYNNASAYVTIVNNSGAQNVFNNGKVYYTTVNQGGYLTTNSDGKSYGALIDQGAYEDVGYNKMAGVSAAGFSYDAQIYGSQYVYSGSIVSNATVFSDGQQTLLNAGSATNLVLSGGTVNVSSGGTIKNDVTFVNSGTVNVYSGAIVSTALNNHGTENIYLGGSAVNTIINNKSLQNISGGAIALNTRVNSGGQQILSGTSTNVASATGTTVFAGGQQTILSGGQAGEINMSGGIVNISAGGNINGNINFDTIAGGAVNVFSGASISSQITNSGALYIYNGGKTDNVTIKGGYEHVLNGGTINNTTVNNMGNIYINSGGTANDLTVNSGGNTSIFTDGVASNVNIEDQGYVVLNGGSIATTMIYYGGILNANSGTINTILVNSGGALLISDQVTKEGTLLVQKGGFLNNRKALQDIVIDPNQKQDFNALFNDPTLFAQKDSNQLFTTDQNKTTTDSINNQNQPNPIVTTDENQTPSETVHITNNTDLNSLLNNPDYFAPVSSVSQTPSPQSRAFFAPTMLAVTTDDFPTQDRNGNPITNVAKVTDSPEAIDLQMLSYTDKDGWTTYSIIPNGKTEADRVWGIENLSQTDSGVMAGGSWLIYGNEAIGRLNDIEYTDPIYAAEGAKLVTQDYFTKADNIYIYKNSSLTATQGSFGNLYVGEGGIVNIANSAKLTGTLNLDSGGVANITTSTGGTISLIGTENNGLIISGNATQNGTKVTSTIEDFDGHDSITLANIQKSNVAGVKYNDKDHVTISLKDGSSITLNIIGIEQTGYTLGEDNNGSLLLNNSDLYTPVNTDQQPTVLQTRSFMMPTTYSASADDLPTTDGDGNPITWADDMWNDSSQAAKDLDLRMYYDKDGNPYYSFIPPGQTNRIWKVNSGYAGGNVGDITYLPEGYKSILIYDDTKVETSSSTSEYPSTYYVGPEATILIDTKSNVKDIIIYNNGTVTATDGSIGNLQVGEGGVANIADPAKLTGTLSLDNGGKANITTSTGGIVSLTGTENKGLVISGKAAQNGTTVASTIMDFDGHDSLTLQDIQRSDVASVKFDGADHVTITLKDGSSITLNIIGIEQTGYTLGANSDGSLTFEACFLAGTAITTQDGIMAVETINIGDIIKVFDWKTGQTNNAVVSWVGKKYTTVKTGMPDDLAGYPVRILKDAITDNVPNQDLLVTPEHCLFFAGNFIPARMLVNDRSIYYDHSITAYDYYHIETETHSVIWANGMLTESYLDTGNKKTFANAQKIVVLFSDAKNWETDAAAPLNVNQDTVKPIYDQIKERALKTHHTLQTTPLPLTNDPNLYLVTEQGTVIQPHSCNKGKYIFNIPKNINIVNIISRTARPCQAIGPYIDDRRELGVLVSNIFVINHNNMQEITDHLSNPELDGWDVIEPSPCRWTNGNAELNINSDNNDKKVLIICLLAAGPYIIQNKEKYKMAI